MAPKTRTGSQSPARTAPTTIEPRVALTLPRFHRWGTLGSGGGEWVDVDGTTHAIDMKFLDKPEDTPCRLLALHLLARDLVADTSRAFLADGTPNLVVASYPAALYQLDDEDLTRTARVLGLPTTAAFYTPAEEMSIPERVGMMQAVMRQVCTSTQPFACIPLHVHSYPQKNSQRIQWGSNPQYQSGRLVPIPLGYVYLYMQQHMGGIPFVRRRSRIPALIHSIE